MALFDFVLPLDEGPVFQLDPKLVRVLYEERFDVELGQGVHLNWKKIISWKSFLSFWECEFDLIILIFG